MPSLLNANRVLLPCDQSAAHVKHGDRQHGRMVVPLVQSVTESDPEDREPTLRRKGQIGSEMNGKNDTSPLAGTASLVKSDEWV